MTSNILILLGYYAIALAIVAGWTYRDHAVTRRRAASAPRGGDRLASGFLNRVAVLLGLLSTGGAALLLLLLLKPALATWLVAVIAAGDGIVTFGAVELVLRMWQRWFGVDPLADLRVARAPEIGAETAEDSTQD